ncbi:MAG TPA: hypothetical protein PKK26_07485 [Candidatus Wallbacteria bacterium]|nr:hypothetical protein [Candidatus Wallbacteria bacterium]
MKENNDRSQQNQNEIKKENKSLTKDSQRGLNIIDKLMLSLMICLTLFIVVYIVSKLLGVH